MRGAGLAQPLNLLKRPEPEKSDKLSILPRDIALPAGDAMVLVKPATAVQWRRCHRLKCMGATCRGIVIAKIRRKPQFHPHQGRHPMDDG